MLLFHCAMFSIERKLVMKTISGDQLCYGDNRRWTRSFTSNIPWSYMTGTCVCCIAHEFAEGWFLVEILRSCTLGRFRQKPTDQPVQKISRKGEKMIQSILAKQEVMLSSGLVISPEKCWFFGSSQLSNDRIEWCDSYQWQNKNSTDKPNIMCGQNTVLPNLIIYITREMLVFRIVTT